MPIPSPNKNESQNDYIGRCVGMLAGKGEGESDSQRAAICHSKWKQTKAEEAAINVVLQKFRAQMMEDDMDDEDEHSEDCECEHCMEE